MTFSTYTHTTIEEVFAELKTSTSGLSKKEALLRTKEYGFNEVAVTSHYLMEIFMRQIKSPFFYLLLIASVTSFFIGAKVDAIVLLLFMGINIVIGFFQEFRAQKAVSLLARLIPKRVTVMRDSALEVIEKREIVPGDVVVLQSGDVVPAELRIIELKNLLVDESALTGESVPLSKTVEVLGKKDPQLFEANNILFSGTSVVAGKVKGVVVATGEDTVFGQIVHQTTASHHGGAYEKNLVYFSRLMLRIVTVTIIVVFLLNLILKGTDTIFSFLLFCVALIVSILPEALPAIVTLALSKGSIRMAKEHVVVKRLSAIEDLGNIEILCSDKTGTLTQNILSLEKIISFDKQKALLYALLGSETQGGNPKNNNPFDSAFLERAGHETVRELKKYTILSELPFDSFRMRASYYATNRRGELFLITKGAPEVIVKLCSKFTNGFTKREIQEDVAKEGLDGKRVLAIAYKKVGQVNQPISKKDEKELTFLGYFVFEDPLKATAEEAIRLAKKLGVQIKIITGDAKEVSGYVAKKVGLVTNYEKVFLGQDLEKMHKDEFDEACEDGVVFARVSPDIKHKIILSLQKKYEVGFLGEGINDAPALKTADVGIAVDGASDIAREAADVVLLEKDLRVVVDGVKHGRTIFANINKYIKCALASNFGNFYSIAVISLFINFLPMLSVQILLGNILSDFPLISLATDSVDVEELRKPKMYQLHMVLPLIISLALVSTVFDFIFFTMFHGQQPGTIQTLWFVMSILTEIVLIFVIRTKKQFWKAKKPGTWILFFTIIDGIFIIALPFLPFGQSIFHFVAPPIIPLLTVFFLVGAYFVASEMVKLVYFHYFKLSRRTLDEGK